MMKMIDFLLHFLKGNYCIAVTYTDGKSFLNLRKWHIICQYMFIFGKVITFLTLPMFRDKSQRQKWLNVNNFFISQPIFKCNMSIASVMSHLSNTIL